MTDWFRIPAVTEQQKEAFEAKLKRSRSSRHEYMRIQALALSYAGAYKQAIEMIDRQIAENPNSCDLTLLLATKASCQAALGDDEQTIENYRKSIEQASNRPSVQANAHIEYALWAIRHRKVALYPEVLDTITEFWDHNPLFPVIEFQQFACVAIVLDALGHRDDAFEPARRALNAAAKLRSNAAKHRDLGLVGDRHKDIRNRLEKIAGRARPQRSEVDARTLLSRLTKWIKGS
jgi:tetratricopeptide (TPR) repeat protein